MANKRPITFGYQRQAGKSRSHVAAIWGPPRRKSRSLGTKLKPKNFEFGKFIYPQPKSSIPHLITIENIRFAQQYLFAEDPFI